MRAFPDSPRPTLSLGRLTRDLLDKQILPAEIAKPLAEVTALANRAVHGEYVAPDVAEEIADVGLRVLGAIRQENNRGSLPAARYSPEGRA